MKNAVVGVFDLIVLPYVYWLLVWSLFYYGEVTAGESMDWAGLFGSAAVSYGLFMIYMTIAAIVRRRKKEKNVKQ